MTIEEAFGEVVKGLRRKRKLSWKHLTEVTGISQNGLWEIETGRVSTKLANVYRLAVAFGMEPDELVKRTSIVYRDARNLKN